MLTMNRAALGALGVSLLAVGLMAGLYFAFSCAVMPGLVRSEDRRFIATMQRINVAILNPAFLFCFIGGLVFPLVAALLEWRLGNRAAALWTLAAGGLYLVTLMITVAVSVPLNEALAAAGDPERIPDPAAVRRAFERPWVLWNGVRALFATLALGCLGGALLLHGRMWEGK